MNLDKISKFFTVLNLVGALSAILIAYIMYAIYAISDKSALYLVSVMSVLAAFASAYVAHRTYNYLENKDAKEFNKDLYGVTTHLVGVYYYLENLYNVHSTVNTEITMNLITNIKNTDKNIIDTTNQFFFNSNFTTNVNTKLSYFIKSYIEWRGYKILNETDIFVEVRKICILKLNIFKALKTILIDYKNDEKISSIIDFSLEEIDIWLARTKKEINKTTYIHDNLKVLFFSPFFKQYHCDKTFITAYFFKCFFFTPLLPTDFQYILLILFEKDITEVDFIRKTFSTSEGDELTVNGLIDFFDFVLNKKTGHT